MKPYDTEKLEDGGTSRREKCAEAGKEVRALMRKELEAQRAELLAALEALTEWGCAYTSPREPNSPHQLLITARAAIARAGKGRI